jgi:hypothetical protein
MIRFQLFGHCWLLFVVLTVAANRATATAASSPASASAGDSHADNHTCDAAVSGSGSGSTCRPDSPPKRMRKETADTDSVNNRAAADNNHKDSKGHSGRFSSNDSTPSTNTTPPPNNNNKISSQTDDDSEAEASSTNPPLLRTFPDQCQLYMAQSSIPNAGIGIFTAVDLQRGSQVGEPELVVPLTDILFQNHWLIDDVQWNTGLDPRLYFESHHANSIYYPGFGAQINCHMGLNNVEHTFPQYNSAGYHRSNDPGVGGFTNWHGMGNTVLSDVQAGEELFVNYGDNWFLEREHQIGLIPLEDDFPVADKIVETLHGLGAGILGVDGDTNHKAADSHSNSLRKEVELLQDVLTLVRDIVPARTASAIPSSWTDLAQAAAHGTARHSLGGLESLKTHAWLEEHASCVDHIYVSASSIPQAGRGAFAKRGLTKGQVVSPAPMLQVLRHQTYLYEPLPPRRNSDGHAWDHDAPVGIQLLRNYAWGHPASSMLLLPYSPNVNFINHGSSSSASGNSGNKANVELRWSSNEHPMNRFEEWSKNAPSEVVLKGFGLLMEFVAIADIAPHEEILVDYGPEWEAAWKTHVDEWTSPFKGSYKDEEEGEDEDDYVPVDELDATWIKTQEEQTLDPYPRNIDTACYFSHSFDTKYDEMKDSDKPRHFMVQWHREKNNGCIRYCDILQRHTKEHKMDATTNTVSEYYYSVKLRPSYIPAAMPEHCWMDPNETIFVKNMPASAVVLMDKRFSRDQHLPGSFRHEIGLGTHLFPKQWLDQAALPSSTHIHAHKNDSNSNDSHENNESNPTDTAAAAATALIRRAQYEKLEAVAREGRSRRNNSGNQGNSKKNSSSSKAEAENAATQDNSKTRDTTIQPSSSSPSTVTEIRASPPYSPPTDYSQIAPPTTTVPPKQQHKSHPPRQQRKKRNIKRKTFSDTCELYLAPSSIPNAGIGIYTAVDVGDGAPLGDAELAVPLVNYPGEPWMLPDEVLWTKDAVNDLLLFEGYSSTESFIPGFGAQINCHMGLNNVEHSLASIDRAGLWPDTDPGSNARSMWGGITNNAVRSIAAGEELFIDYGEHWFHHRNLDFVPFEPDFVQADAIVANLTKVLGLNTNKNTNKSNDPHDPIVAQSLLDTIRNMQSTRVAFALPSKIDDLEEALEVGTARFGLGGRHSIRTPEWLQQHGSCIDHIYIEPSTIFQAGLGAFLKRSLIKGDIVAPAPLLHLPRSNLEYVHGAFGKRTQLLLNYCLGHADSQVLLLPYAPMTNYMNHAPSESSLSSGSGQTNDSPAPHANVELRWSKTDEGDNNINKNKEWWKLSSKQLLKKGFGLSMEFVALRDLEEGEELFLNYGDAWQDEWNNFVEHWNPTDKALEYVDPDDMNVPMRKARDIRTSIEEHETPYPYNIGTACFYVPYKLEPEQEHGDHHEYNAATQQHTFFMSWDEDQNDGCLRPCVIQEIEVEDHDDDDDDDNDDDDDDDNDSKTQFRVTAQMMNVPHLADECFLPPDQTHFVNEIPEYAVRFVDRPLTRDPYINPHYNFRRHIDLPDGMEFPQAWLDSI